MTGKLKLSGDLSKALAWFREHKNDDEYQFMLMTEDEVNERTFSNEGTISFLFNIYIMYLH